MAETTPGSTFESQALSLLPGLWEARLFSNSPGKAPVEVSFLKLLKRQRREALGSGRRVDAVRKCSAGAWPIQLKGALGGFHVRTRVLGLQEAEVRKEDAQNHPGSKTFSLKWALPALNSGLEIHLAISCNNFLLVSQCFGSDRL